MPELKFNALTHEYWLIEEGKPDLLLPNVTKIIDPLSEYHKIPKPVLENKRILGTQFHYAIKLYSNNDLDEESFQRDFPELIKPLEGFKDWWKKSFSNSPIPSCGMSVVEEPAYHKKLLYAGTSDMVLIEDIYEFKLRKYNPILDPLQLAAYKGLYSDFPDKKPWVVSFDMEGNYEQIDASNKQAWGIFRKLLEHYWSEIKFQKLLEGYKNACNRK